MKKVMYICLGLLVVGGLGVGFWFMKSGNTSDDLQPTAEVSNDTYSNQTVAAAYKGLGTTKHLVEFDTQVPALTQLEVAENVIFFAPSKKAVDTFTTETSLSLAKFLPYHVVVQQAQSDLSDGQKLKTIDGQELLVMKKGNDLFVRDAKGNDAQLRKPVNAKNGKLYLIDKVMLTQ